LAKYPKYYEAYIYRGKLYLKTKNYKKALADFDRAIGLDGQKQIGLIGKGDCLRLMEKYDEAKSLYTRALQQKANNLSILLRRAICNV
jgi:tetratricopeptide (TPR) repeat protein